MHAYLVWHQQEIVVLTPYLPAFVDELKQIVPYHARRWDADAKCWRIGRSYESSLVRLIDNYFDSVDDLSPGARTASVEHTAGDCLTRVRAQYSDCAELCVWPNAPRSVVDAAYRALAKDRHPDRRGGQGHAEMVTLNQAYDRLTRP